MWKPFRDANVSILISNTHVLRLCACFTSEAERGGQRGRENGRSVPNPRYLVSVAGRGGKESRNTMRAAKKTQSPIVRRGVPKKSRPHLPPRLSSRCLIFVFSFALFFRQRRPNYVRPPPPKYLPEHKEHNYTWTRALGGRFISSVHRSRTHSYNPPSPRGLRTRTGNHSEPTASASDSSSMGRNGRPMPWRAYFRSSSPDTPRRRHRAFLFYLGGSA